MFSTALILGLAWTAFALDSPPGLVTPTACQRIAAEVSNATNVYYPGSLSYKVDNEHFASSSSQISSCSVEPGSVEDVGTILRILGQTRMPFGVKGGGHAFNPGFSSTTGVQIAMTRSLEPPRFQCPWRESIRDRCGWLHSWWRNQYGLAIDNVAAYELVMPNGNVTNVTASSDPDLFFSLKGGGNNFGVVTRFTLKTFPQGNIWGGTTLFPATVLSPFTAAAAKFSSEVTDPKAAMIIAFGYAAQQIFLTTVMVYDGPVPPRGIFDAFLNMSSFQLDVKERTFVDLNESTQLVIAPVVRPRTIYNDIPTSNYSKDTIDSLVEEMKSWGAKFDLDSTKIITYYLEPFLPTLFKHAAEGSSAYPGLRERLVLPTQISLGWVLESEDSVFYDAAREMTQKLGMAGAPRYPNYAIFGTPVVDMYGEEGLKRMVTTKERVDPDGVMQLTGGFKV
ncbi:FAD-binding domain-containing protein [Armillaria gallica]|uniref:FAD-binding domain-containing protein n=1 Tax=Armillaria gallica TaxID=47427 RepID=A0A2H3CQP0_ARMGA|nr:FAD-binding domain-containing protein [Armillaria gallica]